MRNKNFWILLLLLLAGIVLGGFIGNLTAGIPMLSWLSFGQSFGITPPHQSGPGDPGDHLRDEHQNHHGQHHRHRHRAAGFPLDLASRTGAGAACCRLSDAADGGEHFPCPIRGLESHTVRRIMHSVTMKELPPEERPYEKCLRNGPESLSDPELLAVIIRTGSRQESSLSLSKRVLEMDGGDGLLGLLHRSLPELMEIPGIGPVKAVQLLCIGELSRRIWRQAASGEHAI